MITRTKIVLGRVQSPILGRNQNYLLELVLIVNELYQLVLLIFYKFEIAKLYGRELETKVRTKTRYSNH